MSKSVSNPLLVIDKTIEAIIAEVRFETYPPPIFKASEKTNPFINKENIDYPVGMLDDIKLYFVHYESEEQARSKWIERSKRINLENLFILMTDRDGCTKDDLIEFDNLPYKNKIVFTHVPYDDIKSAVYIKGFEKDNEVGMCFKFKNRFTGKKYYDDFDYVSWFNNKLKN